MSNLVRRTQDERRETTRTAMLDAAVTLFSQKGSLGTTLQDVAEAAGISKGAVTYHFASKDALVDAAFTRCAEVLVERVFAASQTAAQTTGYGSLRQLVAAVWRPFLTGLPEARVMADLAALGQFDLQLAAAVQGGLAALVGTLSRALETCAEAMGAKVDGGTDALAELVVSSAMGASLLGSAPGDETTLGPLGEAVVRAVGSRFVP